MFGTNDVTGKSKFKDAPLDALKVTSIFFTLQGEGPLRGKPAVFVRLTHCNLTCSFCFPANAKVITKEGVTQLRYVNTGDEILSMDDDLNPVFNTVTKSIPQWLPVSRFVRVHYREGNATKSKIVTTDHPFNVKNKGFTPAGELRAGQIVHHLSGAKRISELKRVNNPMHNSVTAKNAGKATAERYASGEARPYIRDAKWRAAQSQRMSERNPMHDNDVVRKVTASKVYEKSEFEKVVHQYLEGLGYDVQYVGNDPEFLLGSKKHGYARPDFLFKGTKKVLEVYDETFPRYNEDRSSVEGQAAYRAKRVAHFKRFGYECEFLTTQEMGLKMSYSTRKATIKNKVAVERKLNKFITNGIYILSVDKVIPPKALSSMARAGVYRKDNGGEILVQTLQTDGNHTYCVEGIHTHNCDTFFDDGDWLTYSQIEAKIYQEICNYWNTKGKVVPEWALPGNKPRDDVDEPLSLDSLRSPVLGPYPNIALVITGGEPLLQDNLTAFLTRQLPLWGAVQIESNGIPKADVPEGVILVVSPKCAEREGRATKYLQPGATTLGRADVLKFVMNADADSPYSSVPEWAHAWRSDKPGREIFVSPMNIYNALPEKAKLLRAKKGEITLTERSTVDEVISFWEPGLLDMAANQRNHEYAARYCLEHGFIFNMQLHLFASMA